MVAVTACKISVGKTAKWVAFVPSFLNVQVVGIENSTFKKAQGSELFVFGKKRTIQKDLVKEVEVVPIAQTAITFFKKFFKGVVKSGVGEVFWRGLCF